MLTHTVTSDYFHGSPKQTQNMLQYPRKRPSKSRLVSYGLRTDMDTRSRGLAGRMIPLRNVCKIATMRGENGRYVRPPARWKRKFSYSTKGLLAQAIMVRQRGNGPSDNTNTTLHQARRGISTTKPSMPKMRGGVHRQGIWHGSAVRGRRKGYFYHGRQLKLHE